MSHCTPSNAVRGLNPDLKITSHTLYKVSLRHFPELLPHPNFRVFTPF